MNQLTSGESLRQDSGRRDRTAAMSTLANLAIAVVAIAIISAVLLDLTVSIPDVDAAERAAEPPAAGVEGLIYSP